MKKIFTQTVELRTGNTYDAEQLMTLPAVICSHAGLDYAYTQTDTGCFLKPTFRNMPYRNSFVPEIEIAVSGGEYQTVLVMKGRPVRFVRLFMTFWLTWMMIMEILFLAHAALADGRNLLTVVLPAVMWVFGYFLCKIGMKVAFQSVVKAIEKELI